MVKVRQELLLENKAHIKRWIRRGQELHQTHYTSTQQPTLHTSTICIPIKLAHYVVHCHWSLALEEDCVWQNLSIFISPWYTGQHRLSSNHTASRVWMATVNGCTVIPRNIALQFSCLHDIADFIWKRKSQIFRCFVGFCRWYWRSSVSWVLTGWAKESTIRSSIISHIQHQHFCCINC